MQQQVREATVTAVRMSLRARQHTDVHALAAAAARAGGHDVTAGWHGTTLEVEFVVDGARSVAAICALVAATGGARVLRARSWEVATLAVP